jgi:hypothetical protein
MTRYLRSPLALALLCSPACGSLVTPDYAGDPLLHLVGKVTIEDDETEGKLRPALAFPNEDHGRLYIMDVAARGEFPSNFSLEVHLPPGVEALMEGPPGEPRFTLGYITAVTAEHAPFIPFTTSDGVSGHCDEEACYQEYETCTNDRSSCYRETRRCDLDMENCVVTASEGDPSLIENPWKSFAGLSVNYRVLYLAGPAAAGSVLSDEFAAGAALPGGYHLLHVRQQTPEEEQAADECIARAEADVVAAYNSAHGTNFETLDDLTEPCQADGTPCQALDDEAMEAIWEQIDQSRDELGCQLSREIYTVVKHPERTRITVQIARDVGPFEYSDLLEDL